MKFFFSSENQQKIKNTSSHVPLDLYILAIGLGILTIAALTLLLYTHTNFFKRPNKPSKYQYAQAKKAAPDRRLNQKPTITLISDDNVHKMYQQVGTLYGDKAVDVGENVRLTSQ